MKNLSDQDAFDAVTGAGAFGYSWYGAVSLNHHEQTAWVRMETGSADPEYVDKTLTVDDLRKAAVDMLAETPGYAEWDWSDPEIDSSIDANCADCILQWAMLGSIVFG